MSLVRLLRSALIPLGLLYELASRVDAARRERRAIRSRLPVISVGNISVGGSGKTPLVAYLAAHLESRWPVLVVSRGYGRVDRHDRLWHAGDAPPDPSVVGDEPALLSRSLRRGAIAVSNDRSGFLVRVEGSFGGSVAILDDGFQHRRLARDLDIVIVDDASASPPHLPIPAGRLRERPAALRRADVVIATSGAARDLAARFVSADRIFTASTVPKGIVRWSPGMRPKSAVPGSILPAGTESSRPVSHAADRPAPKAPDPESTAAGLVGAEAPEPGTGPVEPLPTDRRSFVLVTGIARPERVTRALHELGHAVTQHLRFADHRRYTTRDVARIDRALREHPGSALVTTAKDAVKLERFSSIAARLDVLEIGLRIDEGERFLRIVEEAILCATGETTTGQHRPERTGDHLRSEWG